MPKYADIFNEKRGKTTEFLFELYTQCFQVVTSVVVPRTDFILGLADLTGEVMRQAINCVGLGHISVCFDLLDFLVR